MNNVELRFALQKNNFIIARLVSGGVSSILNYDINLSDDVVVAVNEACIILYKQNFDYVDVTFKLGDNLTICVKGVGDNAKKCDDDLEFAVSLINELVDKVLYDSNKGIIDFIEMQVSGK